MLTKISYASNSLQPAGYLYSQVFLSTVQTSILSYKHHSITVARQLASQVKNKAHIILFIVDSFLWLYKSSAERNYIWVVSQTNAWYVMLTGTYISTVTLKPLSELSKSKLSIIGILHITK